ncbi:MAG TPA: SBBP repeat-containing protein [Candidatus Angelobacter sp.]
MPRVLSSLLSVSLFLISVFSLAFAQTATTTPIAPMSLPLVFEANRGQTAPQVQYVARSREGALFFMNDGLAVAVPQLGAFRLRFEGATAAPEIIADGKLMARSNYLNSDLRKSVTGVENYSTLRYRAVYPGIDVKFYGHDRHLEHDFLLAPGADPSRIEVRLEGIEKMAIRPDGAVELTLGKIALTESAPVAWQMIDKKRVSVQARWKLLGENRLGFSVGRYDPAQPLTIDPVLAYATLTGGRAGFRAVALDPHGNIYLAGSTSATDFPTTAGAYQRTPLFPTNGFVAKFDKTGKILLYSTFLHSSIDFIAVDAKGEVYTAKNFDDSSPGQIPGFDPGVSVDKLSADGSKLLYSMVLGRSSSSPSCKIVDWSIVHGIAADNVGHVWIAGHTGNPCLPTTAGSFQPTKPGNFFTGFVAKLDSTKTSAGSIMYATYLGGSSADTAGPITVDRSGNAYVTGDAFSQDFPHTASFGTNDLPRSEGFSAVFVTKLDPSGSRAVFSVLLLGEDQGISGIALDPANNVYVAGTTSSWTGFPRTPNAFQRSGTPHCFGGANPPCSAGFVTEINAAGNSLIYSTLLGGSNVDVVGGIAVNNHGMAFLTGWTTSTDFPITSNAFKKTLAFNSTNAFVTALNPGGGSLYYSTLLGGSNRTFGFSLTLNPAWDAYVIGFTADADFPVTPDAFHSGTVPDSFLAKVVIAGDLKASLTENTSTVKRNGLVAFSAHVTNLGPDGSDNVVLTDPVPDGFRFAGISGSTASSCSTPAVGARMGSVVCRKTRLENGQSFAVNIRLRAIATAGRMLTNRITTSARTQDLNEANDAAEASVLVKE